MTGSVHGGSAMSITVTGSPPRRQTRSRLPRASTTPGKLWLVRALAALTVIQHASAAHDAAATDETLSLDAQQIDQSLTDADVTVSTAYLYGRTGPYADRVRYQHDIAVAAAETQLEIRSGPGTAGTLFGQLESDLEAAIHADQTVFAANAAAGSDAFNGLEVGIIVLALIMAVGSGWGLTRRLAEYR